MNYVIDENENLVSIDIQEIAFNAAHPIGEIYIQFPGKEDPQTLYGRGSWDNISNEFAGLFFRAEGGDSGTFSTSEVTVQGEGLPNITGSTWSSYYYRPYLHQYGSFNNHVENDDNIHAAGEYDNTWAAGAWADFDASKSNSIYGSSSHVTPINTTIRVWQRTA